METEIKLVRHHFTIIELWEKAIVGIVTSILPLFAFIQGYRYFSHNSWFWIASIAVFASIIAHLYFWNRSIFSLVIIIQFILAGSIVGFHVFASMSKGIELLTGPQTATIFSLPIQIDLINIIDISIAVIVLIYACLMIGYLIKKRREF